MRTSCWARSCTAKAPSSSRCRRRWAPRPEAPRAGSTSAPRTRTRRRCPVAGAASALVRAVVSQACSSVRLARSRSHWQRGGARAVLQKSKPRMQGVSPGPAPHALGLAAGGQAGRGLNAASARATAWAAGDAPVDAVMAAHVAEVARPCQADGGTRERATHAVKHGRVRQGRTCLGGSAHPLEARARASTACRSCKQHTRAGKLLSEGPAVLKNMRGQRDACAHQLLLVPPEVPVLHSDGWSTQGSAAEQMLGLRAHRRRSSRRARTRFSSRRGRGRRAGGGRTRPLRQAVSEE